jgi:hemerythrin-like domain-containing protein
MLEENHIKTENEVLLPLAVKYFDKQKQDSVTMKFKTVQTLEVSHLKHLEFYILLSKLYTENKKSYAENY